ncbi:MAG: ATP-binding protein [Chloroflexota bacterium]|nr:ATP-binding protein [Chloroflexota bacterium]MDE2941649.1 ATP-binding protein [Chloroflexota bacterium]MDE3267292.1 ATP-binding protein [Chloroflexota bacterium]
MTTQIRETIGREAILALANNYPNMTDALMEIIDNPFDYRKGRTILVHVSVIKKANSGGQISVLDVGGEGMDDRGLQEWIHWGTGRLHASTDIGQYHVGGKLASIYLGRSLEIICRKSGSNRIYRFHDPDWGSRTESREFDIEELDLASAAWKDERLSQFPKDSGFTLVRIENLENHRYEKALLLERLASTYRELIRSGASIITLDGVPVEPLEIPESARHADKAVVIPRERLAPRVFVEGRIWVLEPDQIPQGRRISIRAGIRTLFNGRLITQGEEFGHNLAGKGSLQRLIGEISVTGLRPTADKSKWLTSNPNWGVLSEFVREKMRPLVAYLNRMSESTAVPRALRKRTEAVRRDLAIAFKRLEQAAGSPIGTLGEADNPSGRKPAETSDTPRSAAQQSNGSSPSKTSRNRTPPPSDAVGRLLRRTGGNIPKIDFEHLGQGKRTQWGTPGEVIVVNLDYPLYEEESDQYLVEAICLHLLSEDESFKGAPISATMEQIDRIVWAWADVVEGC